MGQRNAENDRYIVFKRNAHALRRFHMSRNDVSHLVRTVAYGADHFGRHFQLARNAFFLGVQHSARYHQLYKVNALFL